MRPDRAARIAASPQFGNGRFHNPLPTRSILPGKLLQAMGRRIPGYAERKPDGQLPIEPRVRGDFAVAPATGLRVTWLGHSSLVLEIDGATLLLDPVWSERASPIPHMGPRRFHPPPLPLDELPPLDALLISHDHYDHLDRDAVGKIAARGVRILTSLGVGERLEGWGIAPERIVELDWHESTSIAGLEITATPARHFSGRGMRDRDRSLWSSWVFAGPRHRVFFTGDTGFFEGLGEIGRAHGPFDLNLIKIGAYSEAWPDIHMTPEDSLRLHAMLGGPAMLAIHWGTFDLSFHPWDEPPERLLEAARTAEVVLLIPRPGEQVEPERPPELRTWWREVGER